MFNPLFHTEMKDRRLKLGQTQDQAAKACRLDRNRWSNLERGYRRPTPAEFRTITTYLKIGTTFLCPPAANKFLLDQAARLKTTPAPFFSHQDRPTYTRFRASVVEDPTLTEELVRRIGMRDDCDMCEHFFHSVSCDSRFETLHLLHLLQLGGIPGMAAPASFGHTRWPIVDCRGRREVGFRPRPCLLLDGIWYFFQVSFRARTVKRVDVLCWQDGWSVIELNGPRHETFKDQMRAAELELPTTFVSDDKLLKLVESGLWKRAG